MRVSDMKLIQLVKHIESIELSMVTLDENNNNNESFLIRKDSIEEIFEIADMSIENEDRTQLETKFEILKVKKESWRNQSEILL